LPDEDRPHLCGKLTTHESHVSIECPFFDENEGLMIEGGGTSIARPLIAEDFFNPMENLI
jgi:hypothetical protein